MLESTLNLMNSQIAWCSSVHCLKLMIVPFGLAR
jgi:hypothetical protein